MSFLEKKLDEGIEKIEKKTQKGIQSARSTIRHYRLFPILAGGVAVFLLMVSMVVVAPYMFLLDVPASATAHEYTPLEAKGRSLYMSLGCFYCHSQQIRLYDWGIGNVSEEGDYVFDSPHALGTERTGPDLAKIGGMRPTIWHVLHDVDPRSVSPGSIMPNFGFLSNDEIDALVAYIQALGQENLGVNPSITGGDSFHPDVPAEYANVTNQFMPLMLIVNMSYDPNAQVYSGDPVLGSEWGDIFNTGKANFTQRCLACHGCSGNAQGPYARHVVTQPANLHERISTFPGEDYHLWRVSEGVPGTAMPAWHLSLNQTEIQMIAIYELSFVDGSVRTISGDVSDAEGDNFAQTVLNTPQINGTQQDFENGKMIFNLYCAQCHGEGGQGDGPASIATPGGYINPQPANFTESGSDFQYYGRYIWKATEGVETTNMPPWKWALSSTEISDAILYVQAFSTTDDYNSKWGPQYNDSFARNLKNPIGAGSLVPDISPTTNPAALIVLMSSLILWDLCHRRIMTVLEKTKSETVTSVFALRGLFGWK
ncbi:MAG TPA: cbb3-type cytochrome c oxidase subunit II [Candidatus Eisenbacteria bacterium]|nr:cbb3-type cytochrome c oxidase subunit II [Candidatus Eisenbacteria bacterium]